LRQRGQQRCTVNSSERVAPVIEVPELRKQVKDVLWERPFQGKVTPKLGWCHGSP
jgi:hypothetical protein